MDARFFPSFNNLGQKKHLITLLKNYFPINYQEIQNFCWLYPFSNEQGYADVLLNLQNAKLQETDKIKVAILFGESNFISILPELTPHADIIIMADIEPRVHQHNQYLLDCMFNSKNKNHYSENYIQGQNPLIGQPLYQYGESCKATSDLLYTLLSRSSTSHESLTDSHFLHSEARFQQCKKSLKNISFVHINLDLNNKEKCEELADLLNKNNATITLCNFTNIHDYPAYYVSQFAFSPEPSKNFLPKSTSALLKFSQKSFIMYALSEQITKPSDIVNGQYTYYIGNLKTTLSEGLYQYHTHALHYSPSLKLNCH